MLQIGSLNLLTSLFSLKMERLLITLECLVISLSQHSVQAST